MTLSVTTTGVTWDAASSGSIASGGNRTSESFQTAGSVFQAKFQLTASNTGTPASGDTMDFYLQESADGNLFGTATQTQHLVRLDTNTNNPARGSVWIPGPFTSWRIYAVNNSGGRTINAEASMVGQAG